MGLCRGMLFYRPERVEAPLAADGRRRPSNAQYGCWLSHKIVCANAAVLLERADDIPILVLEDDFRFLPSWTSAKRRHIQRVLRRYYLGHVPLYGGYPVLSRRWPFVRGSLWRLRPLMTHAYIVSARGRAQIAASTPMNHRRPCGLMGVFDAWCATHLEAYGHMPGLVGQQSVNPSGRGLNPKERFIDFHCRHNALVEWPALFLLPSAVVALLAFALRSPSFLLLCLVILILVLVHLF